MNKYKIGLSIVLVLLLCTTYFVIQSSYAINLDSNSIYSRDELSEIIKNQDTNISSLEELINSSSNINIYLNNEKIDKLDSSKQYRLLSYNCTSDEEISMNSDYKTVAVKNISADSQCSINLGNHFEELYTYNSNVDFYTFTTPLYW